MSLLRYPNIEAERARRGMSVSDMVRAIGLKSRKTYYNWISKGRIPQDKLLIMAELFGCSIDYLLDDKRERNDHIE